MKKGDKTMATKTYGHSAYWYAYHKGWTYSEAKTLAGQYLDIHSYRPRNGGRGLLALCGGDAKLLDSSFNPLLFCACAMVDIGKAMRDEVAKFADPAERDNMKRNLLRDLRRLRRPFYYARETERRRALAAARRKLSRRTTAAAMPSPEDLLAAWNAMKDSREAMIRLGGMLHDLECFVDNRLTHALQGFGRAAQAGDGDEGPEADRRPSRRKPEARSRRSAPRRPEAGVFGPFRRARAFGFAGNGASGRPEEPEGFADFKGKALEEKAKIAERSR